MTCIVKLFFYKIALNLNTEQYLKTHIIFNLITYNIALS